MADPDLLLVHLVPLARTALDRCRSRSGLAEVDIANRALALYDYVDELLGEGHELLVRNGRTGEVQEIRLL